MQVINGDGSWTRERPHCAGSCDGHGIEHAAATSLVYFGLEKIIDVEGNDLIDQPRLCRKLGVSPNGVRNQREGIGVGLFELRTPPFLIQGSSQWLEKASAMACSFDPF